ncbi:MAG: tetratricopeptide repeat protein [Polyangiaceae bacterium]|nr:tetratricopeptide repeat protein [Polyangiaceae bacterium]
MFGLSPAWLRASALALYIAACLCLRRALHLATQRFAFAEVAAWVFAMHPVHVESVAWLSGRKDVLSLLFVSAALAAYAGRSRVLHGCVPFLLFFAHLSKSMTVSALGLLFVIDLLARRRPDVRVLAACTLSAAVAIGLHTAVGDQVGMTQPHTGGGRLSQALTMGPVVLRYLALLVWPPALSLVQDVPAVVRPTTWAVVGLLVPVAWGAFGLWCWRARGRPLALASFLAFFVPIVPVSQVLFPLQNQMADRYLFLSVLAVALTVGRLFAEWSTPSFAAAPVTVVAFGIATAERAFILASSELAFADAAAKTALSPVAPYQLAAALEERGDEHGALARYEEALERSRGRSEVGRRATNNIAKLRAKRNDLRGAVDVLEQGRVRWPDDPKMLLNLVRALSRAGRTPEARLAYDELVRRFPHEVQGAGHADDTPVSR